MTIRQFLASIDRTAAALLVLNVGAGLIAAVAVWAVVTR